jgi:NitT/TauT family transport system permease protein
VKPTGNGRTLKWGAPIVVGVLFVLIWHYAIQALSISKFVVPEPELVLQTLIANRGLLFGSLLITLKITFGAFFLAVLVGTVIAFLFVQSRVVEASFFPYAVLLQVTPIVAIAPLIIIWVKNTTAALVVCATLVALFPIISNTTLGLRSVNSGLVNLFRMNKASRWQTLVKLRIPSAAPYFFGGLRISSGLALIGAVVAEFVAGTGGSSAGLAYQILQAGYQINIPLLFAALLLITVTGVGLFLLMVFLSKLALGNWHESEVAQER